MPTNDPYASAPQCRPTRGPAPAVGDTVFVQQSYDLVEGRVTKINRTTATVFFDHFGFVPHSRNVPFEKIALAHEPIVCVCEYWRGVNGSGGYRIDRGLHAPHLIPAGLLPAQGYLCEQLPGILAPGQSVQNLILKKNNQDVFLSAVSGMSP